MGVAAAILGCQSACPDVEADWNALAELGRGNKLLAFAADGFRRMGLAVPGDFSAAVGAYRRSVMRLNLFNMASLAPVMALFEERGIRAILFKGALQQHLLYGDYFLRPATDIDILIAQRDFRAASDALRDGGYHLPAECDRLWWRHFLGEQHFFSPDGARATVDLHHRIQQPGCPQPRRTEACLDDPLRMRVGNAEIACISRVNGALLTCLSFVKAMTQHENSAAYLADFCAFMLQLTPAQRRELTGRARRQGLLNTLRFTLTCAQHIFGLPHLDDMPAAFDDMPIAGRDLLLAIFDAENPTIRWPRLRHTLWELCDEGVIGRRARAYVLVGMNLMASKMVRNWGRSVSH